ncbi:hypothetical protein DL96DRAFT_1714215 [Flagelloscypha sp. PMI_526]|nr:hypothetical protein DL96DRAFT_1714215 [Flagelloscypha sp. PMI_526]
MHFTSFLILAPFSTQLALANSGPISSPVHDHATIFEPTPPYASSILPKSSPQRGDKSANSYFPVSRVASAAMSASPTLNQDSAEIDTTAQGSIFPTESLLPSDEKSMDLVSSTFADTSTGKYSNMPVITPVIPTIPAAASSASFFPPQPSAFIKSNAASRAAITSFSIIIPLLIVQAYDLA